MSVASETRWQSASTAVAFVASVSREMTKQDDRRSCDRLPIAIPISVQPLGETLECDGEPIDGISRDLAANGIGFYHTEPLRQEYVEVSAESLRGERVVVLGQVMHSQRFGNFMFTGVQFLFGIDED